MPAVTAPFGEWLPDQPALANPGATIALNVMPDAASYRPFYALAPITAPLTAYCRGAIAVQDTAGNNLAYAGDAGALYRSDSADWTDASKPGGYTLSALSSWQMTLWPSIALGEPRVFAMAYDAPIQTIDVGATQFADLVTGTLKPTARALCALTTPPFLMLGGTQDDVYGEKPTRIWWSHIGNPALFDQSQEFECDFQDLPDSIGFVRALVPIGRGAIVLADEALYRATYEGPPTVFGFSEIAGGLGCIAGGSVIKVGSLVYYLSRSGWRVTDGETSKSIGTGKVDRWALASLDVTHAYRISGCYDAEAQCVRWALPMRGNDGGRPNTMLVMHTPSGRWSYAAQDCEFAFNAVTPGFTLDGLDQVSLDLDTLPAPLDDPIWQGGFKRGGGFTSDHRMGIFSGDPLTAQIETTEVTVGNGAVGTIAWVRPLVDAGPGVTVATAARMTQAAAPAYGPAAAIDETGKACLRMTGRYLRSIVTITGDFAHAMGVEANVMPRGER